MKRLTTIEKQLAFATCDALNNGIINYYDKCTYDYALNKFRFYSCDSDKVIYLSFRKMINLLNNELKEYREEIIENYCEQ